jgi:uncharacterized damage-inducible protein DinB
MNEKSRAAAPTSFGFIDDMEEELASTKRVLERVPEGQGSWRPHEKSKSLGELARHLADIPGLAAAILETEEMDALARPPREPLNTSGELMAHFDGGVSALRAALGRADDERMRGEWALRAGDRVFVRRPRRALMRTMFLSHMIHHRAQLGVYLRLLNVPVPGVYGPSADEPFRG